MERNSRARDLGAYSRSATRKKTIAVEALVEGKQNLFLVFHNGTVEIGEPEKMGHEKVSVTTFSVGQK